MASSDQPSSPSTDSRDSAAISGVEIAPGIVVPDAMLRFSFARASGPGGQNVNKVNTQATLRITVGALVGPGWLSPEDADRLRSLAGSRLTNDDELMLVSDRHRSQHRNRKDCLDRLRDLLIRAKSRPKKRKRTRRTRASIERRLAAKRQRSETKRRRQRPSDQ